RRRHTRFSRDWSSDVCSSDLAEWQAQIESLQQKIQRLEPVNLAAIQEHAEQSERKQYLDAQMNDLTSALETLENAIRKIDRETRDRKSVVEGKRTAHDRRTLQ